MYANQYERNATKFFNSKIQWDFGKIKLENNTHWFDHRDELAYDKRIGGWDNYSNTEIGANFNANAIKESKPSTSYVLSLKSV